MRVWLLTCLLFFLGSKLNDLPHKQMVTFSFKNERLYWKKFTTPKFLYFLLNLLSSCFFFSSPFQTSPKFLVAVAHLFMLICPSVLNAFIKLCCFFLSFLFFCAFHCVDWCFTYTVMLDERPQGAASIGRYTG